MREKIGKLLILALCSIVFLLITGCTGSDSDNDAAALTGKPTAAAATGKPKVAKPKAAAATGKPKVAKPTAEELLYEIETWPMSFYSLYNYPSYYYDYLAYKLVSFSEFLDCADYAAVTLSSYKKADFYKNARQPDQKDEDWDSYKYEGFMRDNAIAFDEILLANEDTFDVLSDEEKIEVLKEVKEKLDYRTGDYITSTQSPFLFYVQEQNTAGKSKWYDYIMDSGDEYSKLKEILSKEIMSFGEFNY